MRANGLTHRLLRLVAQTVKNKPAVWEPWVPSLGWEDPLEQDVATHSRILAWRIPWTEEAGGLQSLRSQRAGHAWATKHRAGLVHLVLVIFVVISSKREFPSGPEVWTLCSHCRRPRFNPWRRMKILQAMPSSPPPPPKKKLGKKVGINTCMLPCCVSVVSNSFATPWTVEPARLLCPWDFLGKNTDVGCHFLLQGIFLTQELNSQLLYLSHWQAGFILLHHLGSPYTH